MSDKCPKTGKECSTKASVYKDRRHILHCSPNEKILGTPVEFCGAFYHVSKKGQEMFCLGQRCTNGEPKTAVAFVRYDDDNDQLLFLKRYTNCYSSKTHAEEFFSHDINRSLSHDRSLIKAMHDDKTIKKITMFITMQPCHRSTKGKKGTHDDQSCCRIIAEALVELPHDVKICIKPTHLCKVGYNKKVHKIRSAQQERNNECIDKAEIGIKALMRIRGRIEVSAMKPNDWFFLWNYVNLESRPKITISTFSKREELDKEIEATLEGGEDAFDWEKTFLKESVDDDELIFKALSEMPNCNKNAKIPDFDPNAAMNNLNLEYKLDNIWDVMKHVKRHFRYLGDENYKVQSKYTFLFIRDNRKISWDENSKILENEEIGSERASDSGSQRASGETTGKQKMEKQVENQVEEQVKPSRSKKRRLRRKKSKEKNKNKVKDKNNDVKG